MTKNIGVLTSGSDCPGLNAAIRAIGKSAQGSYGMQIVGFQDGFQGLIEDRTVSLGGGALSGILTSGGTILGTSRDQVEEEKPDGKVIDMTDKAIKTYKKHKLDALVCIGGKTTQESALQLKKSGLNIVTLPKSINNDVNKTELTIGFDPALEVAGQSIDRLHSTAYSHHRIIIVEVMGAHNGWLTLGAGISGGADVILIPEIPYDINKISDAVLQRNQAGKRFSIVAVAERIVSQEQIAFTERLRQINAMMRSDTEQDDVNTQLQKIENKRTDTTFQVSNQLKDFTGLETRITILGYLLRGGAPSAGDRILATQLGTTCTALINEDHYGVMVALQEGRFEPVPLEEVVGEHKQIPLDHPWIQSARRVGTCLGD
jgi:6-phosphofructokinase